MSRVSDCSSSPQCDFIKNEQEIIFKQEFDSCLQNNGESHNRPRICKYDVPFQLLEENPACLEQKTSDIFATADLQLGNAVDAFIDHPLREDSTTVHNVIMKEDMIDNEVLSKNHSADRQHLLMLKVRGEQGNVKNCKADCHLEHRNIFCHVSSDTGTLAEGGLFKSESCKYAENRVLETQISEDLFIHYKTSTTVDNCEYRKRKGRLILPQIRRINCDKGKQTKCKRHPCSSIQKPNLKLQIRTCPVTRLFQCAMCDYSSSRKYSLARHVLSHMAVKPLKCEFCDFTAIQTTTLQQHIRIHTGEHPFRCEFCGYGASQKVYLLTHIRTHTGEKPFKCHLCNYSCAGRGSLVQHIRIHTGEKPFKCQLCDYSATKNGTLVKHIRTHTGEKPFECKFCNYRTSISGNLVLHIRTHTGERPFKCECCNYRASKKASLLQHIRTHTGERPFPCEFCDYSASQKSNLVKHIRTHHMGKSHLDENTLL